MRELLDAEAAEGREFFYVRHERNLGFVGNANAAFAMLDPADVILLNSDVVVGPGWGESLIDASRSRTDIATTTALTSNGALFTVEPPPAWRTNPPSVEAVAVAAEKIRTNSQRLYPFTPLATAFCTLFARKALNIVGVFDPEFAPGYGEEVDFSFRCAAHGFTHIAADNVYVYHSQGESFGENRTNKRKTDNDVLTSRRYSKFHQMANEYFEQEDKSTLALVKRHAKAVLHGFAIAISAEKIHPSLTGTYEVAVQLSHALAQDDRVASVYWVAEGERLEALSGLVRDMDLDVEVVSLHELRAGAIDVDVAFLPHQDHEGTFWPRVAERAHRNIVWQLDLIAALNPHYQESWTSFDRLNEAVERSIDHADAIGVLTPHVGEGLRSRFFGASPKHIFYLPAGAPHDRFERSGRVSTSRHVPAIDRPEIESLSGLPFILVLGTNYLHKNVVWFMRLALLVRSLGWDGKVVIAGPTPGGGGDSTQSQGDLIGLTGSEDVFVQLGTVSEVEKHWLFEHAALVASPAITEGWGMVPAEAALLGTVAIATIGGGLRDVSPANASVLLMEDDAVDAQVVFELLTNDDRRREQLDAWLAAANGFRWDRAASHLVDACASVLLQRRTIQAPSRRSFDDGNRDDAATASVTEDDRRLVPTRLRRTLLIRSLRWFPPGGRKRRVLKSAFGWAMRW